jgi:hypothetical protein
MRTHSSTVTADVQLSAFINKGKPPCSFMDAPSKLCKSPDKERANSSRSMQAATRSAVSPHFCAHEPEISKLLPFRERHYINSLKTEAPNVYTYTQFPVHTEHRSSQLTTSVNII